LRYFSAGGRYLRDDVARGSGFVKVKACPVRPHQIFWIAVVSDLDIPRYLGRGQRARLKIDERRDDDKK
jgi:hypothetical protein